MKRYTRKHLTWKDFPKFAGKDLWILVYSYNDNRHEFIKILSMSSDMNTVYYNSVSADAVRESIFEGDYDWFLSCMTKEKLDNPEIFSVQNPLEILSTEEIIEALHTDMMDD